VPRSWDALRRLGMLALLNVAIATLWQ